MEEEYIACYEATSNAMWLWNLVFALGVVDSAMRLLQLYYDNFAVVSFSNNARRTCRFKHIDINFYFVKENVVEGIIDIEYTLVANMLIDPLTKGLLVWVFEEHASRMGLLKV